MRASVKTIFANPTPARPCVGRWPFAPVFAAGQTLRSATRQITFIAKPQRRKGASDLYAFENSPAIYGWGACARPPFKVPSKDGRIVRLYRAFFRPCRDLVDGFKTAPAINGWAIVSRSCPDNHVCARPSSGPGWPIELRPGLALAVGLLPRPLRPANPCGQPPDSRPAKELLTQRHKSMFVLPVLARLGVTPWLNMSVAIRPVMVIANGVDAPIGMASFPAMETIQAERIADQP